MTDPISNEALDPATVASLIERLERAEAENERMRGALGQCATWFYDYGDGHATKGDTDKAQRNYGRGHFARAALERK